MTRFLRPVSRRTAVGSVITWCLGFATLIATIGCSSGGSGGSGEEASASGEITITAESGVVFGTASTVAGAKFNKVDLFATENGDAVRLQTGGEAITRSEPANWFPQSSGMRQVFSAFDDVPLTKPTDADTAPLVSARTGNGFVIRNYVSGGWTRGWIKSASAGEVTIVYEVVPE